MTTRFDRLVILRSRSYAFVIIIVVGVLCIGLLSADAFTKEGFRTVQESVSITILLAFHTLSTLCIPVFALLDVSDTLECTPWYCHVWFELVWLSILLVFHSTAAVLFTILSPSFDCGNSNADLEGTCKLINVYISIASWITPLVLLSYICYFSMVCLHTAKGFPALWHTSVRLCPWNDGNMWVSKAVPVIRPLSYGAEPWKLEDGARGSVSQLSMSQPPSRGSSQTLVSNLYPSPQRASRFLRPLPQPPVPRRVPSQLPSRGIRTHSSPSRIVSQPLSSRLEPTSRVRAMSQLSPSRVPSCPASLQHAATRGPSRPGSTWPVTPNYYLYNPEGR